MNSPLILTSSLLTKKNVRHGFTTRLGGTSVGRFSSLNVAYEKGDQAPAVTKNLSLVAKQAGFSRSSLCQPVQVHGNRILYVNQPEHRKREADGMVTQTPLMLGIRTADCLPILLWAPPGIKGALHAGWRGTVLQIASCGVQALTQLGATPSEIIVALGPTIGPCCFQVGPEVLSQFEELVPEAISSTFSGHPSIHLWKANQILLERSGVLTKHIDIIPLCTMCHPDLFFSHRRDFKNQGKTGQHLSFI